MGLEAHARDRSVFKLIDRTLAGKSPRPSSPRPGFALKVTAFITGRGQKAAALFPPRARPLAERSAQPPPGPKLTKKLGRKEDGVPPCRPAPPSRAPAPHPAAARATRRARLRQPARVGARVGRSRGVCGTVRGRPCARLRARARRGCGSRCQFDARCGPPLGLAWPRSLGRASSGLPRLRAPRSTPPRGLGCDLVTSSSPFSPFSPGPEEGQRFPHPLWTRRSGASRAGAAGDRSAGSRAAKAPWCGGRTRGQGGGGAPAELSRRPAGRSFPPSAPLAQLPDAKLRLVRAGAERRGAGARGRALSGP